MNFVLLPTDRRDDGLSVLWCRFQAKYSSSSCDATTTSVAHVRRLAISRNAFTSNCFPGCFCSQIIPTRRIKLASLPYVAELRDQGFIVSAQAPIATLPGEYAGNRDAGRWMRAIVCFLQPNTLLAGILTCGRQRVPPGSQT